MSTAEVTEVRLANAGQEMRRYERALIQTIREATGLTAEEAVAAVGYYDRADLQSMAERCGVPLSEPAEETPGQDGLEFGSAA